jgi:hypothetical protein
MTKKTISMFVSLMVLCTIGMATLYAYSDIDDCEQQAFINASLIEHIGEENAQRYWNALDMFQRLDASFPVAFHLDEFSSFRNLLVPIYYAGRYINDNYDLTILLTSAPTPGTVLADIVNNADNYNVVVRFVEHSQDDKRELVYYLLYHPNRELMESLIDSIGLGTSENVVFIGLWEYTEENKELFRTEFSNSPLIRFREPHGIVFFTSCGIDDLTEYYLPYADNYVDVEPFTFSLNPGSWIAPAANSQRATSFGFRVRHRQTRRYGFVTTAHQFLIQRSVTLYGSIVTSQQGRVGQVSQDYILGVNDAAFVHTDLNAWGASTPAGLGNRLPNHNIPGFPVALTHTASFADFQPSGANILSAGATSGVQRNRIIGVEPQVSSTVQTPTGTVTVVLNNVTVVENAGSRVGHGDSGGIIICENRNVEGIIVGGTTTLQRNVFVYLRAERLATLLRVDLF